MVTIISEHGRAGSPFMSPGAFAGFEDDLGPVRASPDEGACGAISSCDIRLVPWAEPDQ